MLPVFSLFLIPVGGGIPAGVLLARKTGLPWHLTAFLYFCSDVCLAFAFEPVLKLGVALGKRWHALAVFIAHMRAATERTAAKYIGSGAGPFTLVLVAFGVDPMTGRAAALAAGHGFIGGWAIAIAGDMMYYAVVAWATLGLSRWFSDPNVAVFVVLMLMISVPVLIRRVKTLLSKP